jgi:phosphatidate cytidylyltransferase
LFAHEGLAAPALGVAFAALLAAIGYSEANFFGPRKPHRVMSWCLIYIGLLGSSLVLTRELGGGRDWVFIAILACFATDTGAYTVGRLIGRHKLAPKISPKKTIEGAVGGLIAGIVAVLALNAAFDTFATTAEMIPLAIAVPILAIAGDLFESWMKRRMGVKDASGLLPGHGGFMDRLDSILFVLPAFYLYIEYIVL